MGDKRLLKYVLQLLQCIPYTRHGIHYDKLHVRRLGTSDEVFNIKAIKLKLITNKIAFAARDLGANT